MDELLTQLTSALGTRYSLERELGGGGMSRVFLATERSLGRLVVVKVLPRDTASRLSVERFKREISLAARLQHPHIVPLLSAGEIDGLPYYTMPFIDGESLRARMDRGDALSVGDAIRLLREVASALEYAHTKNVVHRDIKPENILLAARHAVVADFGVAKALSAATGSGPQLTSVGIALGTPAYMAPEQGAGDPDADHRADIYAFGVVAYELLAGRTPFAGRSAQATIAAHMIETPEPITRRRPAVPTALAGLVMRCLEKEPDRRPQTAADVVRDLDLLHVTDAEKRPPLPTVAVLPLVNTSGDPDSEHFSDGLTDELIGVLSKLPQLVVAGRTSVFALRGKGLDVRAIADTLQVGNVLEGSVRKVGDRIRVRVQLVDTGGRIRWSDAYDRTIHDVFAIQEEIAQAVVAALEIHLAATHGPLVRPATSNVVAYDLYLKGRFVRRRLGPGDLERAIDYYEQAIAIDPEFASAYAWLCDAHVLLVVFGGRLAAEEMPRAREYAIKAVSLDSLLADAHLALAEVLFLWDLDWVGAGREIQRSLALNPGHVDARHLFAIYLLAQRKFEDAEVELTRAIVADPLLADTNMTQGRLYLSIGQADRAVRFLTEALELAPGFSVARGHLANAYLRQGRMTEAIAEFEECAATGAPVDVALLAFGYASCGRVGQAEDLLRSVLDLRTVDYPPPYHVAMVYTALQQADEAFRWLDRALTERAPRLIGELNVEVAFESLRSDSRFATILHKMGLAS